MDVDLSADRVAQRRLSAQQVEAFHHDIFVEDQLRHFDDLVPNCTGRLRVVDVGGGCGFFAGALAARRTGLEASVIDMDPESVATCRTAGVPAVLGDALDPPPELTSDVASFNLILHHLVGSSEARTRALQMRALAAWGRRANRLFVNEYIYESYLAGLSGRLIFAVTRSKWLSALGRAVSRLIPSLHANTFGVGVRFRGHAEWISLFRDAGFEAVAIRFGDPEAVTPARRLLFIRTIRRDSFLLERRQERTK